jgi:hypothetical protein
LVHDFNDDVRGLFDPLPIPIQAAHHNEMIAPAVTE